MKINESKLRKIVKEAIEQTLTGQIDASVEVQRSISRLVQIVEQEGDKFNKLYGELQQNGSGNYTDIEIFDSYCSKLYAICETLENFNEKYKQEQSLIK